MADLGVVASRPKKKRGRPARNTRETPDEQGVEEEAAPTGVGPFPETSPSATPETSSPVGESPVVAPVKRKRGRPRKNPPDLGEPSLDLSKNTGVAAVEPERRSKRRRVDSST